MSASSPLLLSREVRKFKPGESDPLPDGSAGGLNAAARPVIVSGVGSVEDMAATWPGVSDKPGSDSDLIERTELSDSEPSKEAVLALLRVSPDPSIASIRKN